MARVLLINDEPDLLAVCKIVLEAEGHSVDVTNDLSRLIELASTGADLLLVDLVMPRASGEEVVESLRAHAKTRDIPIVVMSALPDGQARARAIRASDFLPKPFTPARLLETIERTLGRTRDTGAAVARRH